MNLRRYRRMIFGFSVVLCVPLLYVIGDSVRQRAGIRVDIRNASGEELRGISIKVEALENRGNRYTVPSLRPGEVKHVFVEPVTESSVVVDFTRANGTTQSKTVFGYAEAGYCGNAELTVLPDEKLESNEVFSCSKGWFDLF